MCEDLLHTARALNPARSCDLGIQHQALRDIDLIIIIIVTPLSLSETNGIQNARTTGRQREADTERNRNHTERNRNHKASHVPSVEKPGKTDVRPNTHPLFTCPRGSPVDTRLAARLPAQERGLCGVIRKSNKLVTGTWHHQHTTCDAPPQPASS
jgi:hypothetical protein